MEIFLSWSKARSRSLAKMLREWLPQVIQATRPWMSSEDIPKGQRWAAEVGKKLSVGTVGIICLTRENMESPWINYEAGALAKSIEMGRVHPFLFDMRPSDIVGPLSDFQSTVVRDRVDMARFISSINDEIAVPLSETVLQNSFDKAWPDLESGMDRLAGDNSGDAPPAARSEEDIMSEILERVREIQRQMAPSQFFVQQGDGSEIGLSDVRRAWDEVLTAVRMKSVREWAVVREATVADFGKVLVLRFQHDVHANMMAKHPKTLADVMRELFGIECRVEATISERDSKGDSTQLEIGQPASI